MEKEMDIYKIGKLKKDVISLLKYAHTQSEKCEKGDEYDPFLEYWPNEIEAIQTDLSSVLDRYMMFLQEWNSGVLQYCDDAEGIRIEANPTSRYNGKNAPAYKGDINAKKIYNLFKQGKSYREIERLTGYSRDLIKRRILEFQLEQKNVR